MPPLLVVELESRQKTAVQVHKDTPSNNKEKETKPNPKRSLEIFLFCFDTI
jgi:hypothetical protein